MVVVWQWWLADLTHKVSWREGYKSGVQKGGVQKWESTF